MIAITAHALAQIEASAPFGARDLFAEMARVFPKCGHQSVFRMGAVTRGVQSSTDRKKLYRDPSATLDSSPTNRKFGIATDRRNTSWNSDAGFAAAAVA